MINWKNMDQLASYKALEQVERVKAKEKAAAAAAEAAENAGKEPENAPAGDGIDISAPLSGSDAVVASPDDAAF